MRILVDMDGTVADFVKEILKRYNEDHNDTLTHEDVTDSDMHSLRCGRKIYDYFHAEGTFRDLEVIDGAKEVINGWLYDGHEVYFVTKPVDHSLYCLQEKQAWVDRHFPRIGHKKVIFTGHKHLVLGDVLIDDMPYNLKDFPKLPILVDQPWNRKADGLFFRKKTWEEINEVVRRWAEEKA